MSELFMPLRSNSAYFTNNQSMESLERRIKMFMMVYDKVHFQDGRYTCSIAEDGGMFETMTPPEGLRLDRSEIYYYEPGSTSTLVFRVPGGPAIPAHQGILIDNYEVDFRAVMDKTGLANEEYIQWDVLDLNDAGKKVAKERAENEEVPLVSIPGLPQNNSRAEKVVEGIYMDSLLGFNLKLPIGIDHRAASFISYKQDQADLMFMGDIPSIFAKAWINLDLPDFSEYSWEEIHELRDTAAVNDLRDMISIIKEKVQRELPNIKNDKELLDLVDNEFSKEQLDWIRNRRATYSDAIIKTGLNFSIVGGAVGTMADFAQAYEDHNSWVSLLERKI